MHDVERTNIQEMLTSCSEVTNRLSKEFVELKKKLMEDREEVVEGMKKEGVLDDILAYLKEEADKGDRVSLNVFNFWKHGKLPE